MSQLGPYDTQLWSLMSYIKPMDQPTRYLRRVSRQRHQLGIGLRCRPGLELFAADADGARHPGGPAPLRRGDQWSAGVRRPGLRLQCQHRGLHRPVFDFSINQHPVVTLWSGGTGNALNLSGFSSDSTINLAPGSFSSAAGLTNNIGIAFGTVIETAIGGGGNDTLLGNDLHNVLRGGAGNDLVRGGAGNDSLWGDSGNDTLSGGIGADVIDPGTGIDIVRDWLVDLNSDMILASGVPPRSTSRAR